jgi:hypothetical protein
VVLLSFVHLGRLGRARSDTPVSPGATASGLVVGMLKWEARHWLSRRVLVWLHAGDPECRVGIAQARERRPCRRARRPPRRTPDGSPPRLRPRTRQRPPATTRSPRSLYSPPSGSSTPQSSRASANYASTISRLGIRRSRPGPGQRQEEHIQGIESEELVDVPRAHGPSSTQPNWHAGSSTRPGPAGEVSSATEWGRGAPSQRFSLREPQSALYGDLRASVAVGGKPTPSRRLAPLAGPASLGDGLFGEDVRERGDQDESRASR